MDAVEHLVGLQAQATPPPYYGLQARLRGFAPEDLSAPLEAGELVRMTLMRGTVHLVTPRDAAFLRPLVQPGIERGHRGQFGRRLGDTTPERVIEVTRAQLAEGALTAREIARVLGGDEEALASAVRAYAPIVQLPPRGVWGKGGTARYGELPLALETDPSVDELVLRYLRAFGPATVMDCQKWSGLTKLKPVFERLDLVRFEDGLFDLPDAPRPDPDAPAPVRLLGEFDNVLLAPRRPLPDHPARLPVGGDARPRPLRQQPARRREPQRHLVAREGRHARDPPLGAIPYDEVEAEARAVPRSRGRATFASSPLYRLRHE